MKKEPTIYLLKRLSDLFVCVCTLVRCLVGQLIINMLSTSPQNNVSVVPVTSQYDFY